MLRLIKISDSGRPEPTDDCARVKYPEERDCAPVRRPHLQMRPMPGLKTRPTYRSPYFFSYGAPVPEEPTKNFCPSGRVMSLALAVVEPSLAWKPSMTSSVPGGMEFLFKPRRIREFGAPHSIAHVWVFPSVLFTAT